MRKKKSIKNMDPAGISKSKNKHFSHIQSNLDILQLTSTCNYLKISNI